MPELGCIDADVSKFQGVHLFHYCYSQCSQRVRLCLEEKGVSWTSHHINLAKEEHLTTEYRRINPKQLVPTLLHDGLVITESNDITCYIDRNFEGPCLIPIESDGVRQIQHWIMLSDGFKGAIKVLSHEYLFKPVAKKEPNHIDDLERRGVHADLIGFYRQFSSEEGFSKNDLKKSLTQAVHMMEVLDESLAKHRFLVGDQLSLADIAWSVDVFRLKILGVPIDEYGFLHAWLERIIQRPGFKRSVISQTPIGMRVFLNLYAPFCRLVGGGVRPLWNEVVAS